MAGGPVWGGPHANVPPPPELTAERRVCPSSDLAETTTMCTLDGCNDGQDLPPIPVTSKERRLFLAGLASLPLATVLSHPELAAAQAAARTAPMDVELPDGTIARGVVAMPETTPAPAVVLIHEWWGLNDQIRSVAAELANLGYVAYAIDLYDGRVAATPEEARTLVGEVDAERAGAQLVGAIEAMRLHEDSTGKVATLGWCFGGGWSINAAMAADLDAAVVYYGTLPQTVEQVAGIDAPVLGHFGTEDDSIDEVMVGGFERAMDAAGKGEALEVHWYTAGHAFANPTGARYDADDAALAWSRTQAFLARHLRG